MFIWIYYSLSVFAFSYEYRYWSNSLVPSVIALFSTDSICTKKIESLCALFAALIVQRSMWLSLLLHSRSSSFFCCFISFIFWSSQRIVFSKRKLNCLSIAVIISYNNQPSTLSLKCCYDQMKSFGHFRLNRVYIVTCRFYKVDTSNILGSTEDSNQTCTLKLPLVDLINLSCKG